MPNALKKLVWVASVALMAAIAVAEVSAQAAPAKPVRVRAKLEGFDVAPKTGATSSRAANQIGGASRGLGVSLIAPVMGKSYSLTPTFYWRPDDPQNEYTFRLALASDPGTFLFEAKVTGNRLTYPADAPVLQPGATYIWTVQPTIDMLGGPVSGMMLIVSGAERESVAAALAHADSAAAQAKVFVDKRLWFDSLAAYTALIESNPSRSEFHKARAELYDQLSNTTDLADADAAKSLR